MLLRIVLLVGLACGVTACAAVDPSSRDLKSPCASDDSNVNSPCIKRIPLENQRV